MTEYTLLRKAEDGGWRGAGKSLTPYRACRAGANAGGPHKIIDGDGTPQAELIRGQWFGSKEFDRALERDKALLAACVLACQHQAAGGEK